MLEKMIRLINLCEYNVLSENKCSSIDLIFF